MKVILTICLVFCLALSANSIRLRTHTKSQSATSQNWQSILDQLIRTGQSSGAVILALDGRVLAAKNLNLQASEGQRLAAIMQNPRMATTMGIPVNGVMYTPVRADLTIVAGRTNSGGVAVARTNSLIIVSIFNVAQLNGGMGAVLSFTTQMRSQGL